MNTLCVNCCVSLAANIRVENPATSSTNREVIKPSITANTYTPTTTDLAVQGMTTDELMQPTSFLPGSEGKIALMRERYSRGLPLFVKGDVRVYRKDY